MPTYARVECATHVQDVESDTWNIQHDLGFTPTISVRVVYDGFLREIMPLEISHTDTNNAVITFSRPFTGEARLT